MKKEPGRTRTRSHLARSDDPPVKHAAPSTLFSALRRPNPENGRIWSPRRVRTNTTRLGWGRACALNPTPGRRGSHQPRSNQTPGRPFTAPAAPAAASQAVALGHPSVRQERRGFPRARAARARRCQSTGQVTTVWPEHSGDSLTFSCPSQKTKHLADPNRRLGTCHRGTPFPLFPFVPRASCGQHAGPL